MGDKNIETHKYQHKIPQVYMRYWRYLDKKEKVYVHKKKHIFESLEKCKNFRYIEDKKRMFMGTSNYINKIGGEDNFYTIFEYSLICTEEDKQRIASGEKRILDIENGWHRMENKWNSIVKGIENNTNNNKVLIGELKKEEIMSFMISMLFRGEKGIENFKEILKQGLLNMDINDSDRKMLIYAIDNIDILAKEALLGEMRKFFDNDGIINKINKIFIENCTLVISKAEGDIEFITSDTPSVFSEMIIKDKENNIIGRGRNLNMPITPKIAISVLLNNKGNKKYRVEHLEDERVKNFNEMMLENSKKYVISNKNNIFDYIVKY